MHINLIFRKRLFIIVLVAFGMSAHAQTLHLTASSPAANTYTAIPASDITITFNQPVQVPASADFYVYSEQQGYVVGSLTTSGNILTFNPAHDLIKGDVVWVSVTKNVQSLVGSLLTNPTFFRFTVASDESSVTPPAFKQFRIPIGDGSTGISPPHTVDFDGDADADIVSGSLWLENDGHGNFTKHDFDEPHSYSQLHVVDLDNDNDMDILLAAYNGVIWIRNNGDDTFTTIALGGHTSIALSLYDKNNDGKLDIVYADQNYGAKSITWLIAQGDGTYTTEVVSTDSYCFGIIAADLNNDGRVDIVGGGETDLYWYRNNGSSYTKIVLDNTGSYYSTTSVDDLDGDGDLDILAGDYEKIVHLINNGDATFTNTTLESSANTNGQTIFAIADYDGDSDPDIISNTEYQSLTLYQNEGGNTFVKKTILTVDYNAVWGQPEDLDGDGDIDLAFLSYYNGLYWAKNTTLGEAIPFEQDEMGVVLPDNTNAAAWADYDNDGDQDVLAMGYTSSGIIFTTLYKQTSNGLEVGQEFSGLHGGSVRWFDYENDGDADFLVSGSYTTQDPYNFVRSRIYINTNGVFAMLAASTTLPGVFNGDVAVADLNNDGRHEVIVLGTESGVFTEDANGFHKILDLPSVFQYAQIAVSDIDLDGDLDLATSGWLGNDELGPLATIFINNGNFTFTEQRRAFNGITSGDLLLQDLDNDSDPELAAIGSHRADGYSYASSSFYKNTNGTFSKIDRPENGPYIAVNYEGAATAGDLNNDGFIDILTQRGSYYSGYSLNLNDKNGWFTELDYTFPGVTSVGPFITLVDYDLDQDLDFQSGKAIVRNNTDIRNTLPTAPTTILDSVRNNMLYTYWSGATDGETPVGGLSYQLYIGSTSNSQDVVGSGAALATGKQFIQKVGLAHNMWKTKLPSGGDFYWGVQSVDGALGTSAFSSQKTSHVIYIDGPTQSCTATPHTYKAIPAGNYSWNIKGGHAISVSASEVEVVWDTEGYGSVSVTDGSIKNALDVVIVTKPTPVISGKSIVCEQGNEEYAVTNINDHAYGWTIEGGVFQNSPHTNQVFIGWNDHGAGKITVFETSAKGICVIENVMIVDKKEKPTPLIDGSSMLCWDNEEHLYSISAVAGNSISWSVFGGTANGNTSSNTLLVKWHDQAMGRVTVKETNAFCSTTEHLEISLLQMKQPDIQGPFVICGTTQSSVYVSENQSDHTYHWTVVNGSINGNSNRATLSVDWSSEAVGMIYLTQSNGVCHAKDSVYVTIYPEIQKPSITYENGMLVATTASTYRWYLDGNLIEETNSRTHNAVDPGKYSVVITDSKGCTAASDAYSFLVTGVDEEIVPVNVYPNPVRDMIIVELENSYRGELNFTIHDLLGRTLFETSSNKQDNRIRQLLNLRSTTSGFLILSVTGENFYFSKKLITEH